jgi:hypothetical protein
MSSGGRVRIRRSEDVVLLVDFSNLSDIALPRDDEIELSEMFTNAFDLL